MDTDDRDRPQSLPHVNDGTPSSGNSSVADDNQAQSQTDNMSSEGSGGSLITNIPVPDEAADSDLIEKEWVERAKQIVEHTRDDPYEQQRAISQMKADYLKKRYNKDINSAAD